MIILTGETDRLLREVTQQVGAIAILTKPIAADDLLHEIQAAVGFLAGPPRTDPAGSSSLGRNLPSVERLARVSVSPNSVRPGKRGRRQWISPRPREA